MILRMISSFSFMRPSFAFLRTCEPILRAHSRSARMISLRIWSMSAIASFASLVKGTFTEATCTRRTTGPIGMPLPPRWSSS
jgi:hypothetical protein